MNKIIIHVFYPSFYTLFCFRPTERIKRLREEVAKLDLGIRFHQGWSWETGQRDLYNVILRPLCALVPVGMPLYKQVRDVGTDQVVVYGSLVDEPSGPNYIYQTASEHIHGKAYTMKFEKFASVVRGRKLRVVFDTKHVLEWFLNKGNVAGLPTDPETVGRTVGELWQELRSFVEEIHLCDFNPRLGPSRGRNVFLEDGVFPLAKFCADIKTTGWNGIVVPEVAPQHFQGKVRLRLLREKVDQLFL